MNPHIPMQTHAENYLSERRRLGYGLRTTGYLGHQRIEKN
jgi:hypothetical protein